jgi:hypothetical protein
MNISLHQVSRIDVTPPTALTTSDGEPFVMRTLVVYSGNRRVEISLFADGRTQAERLINVEINEVVSA